MSDHLPKIDALGDDNYSTWEVYMRSVLISKGLWGAIERGDTVPSDVVFKALDEKAHALITLYLKPMHLSTARQCTTAKELWSSLKDFYKKKGVARRLQLRRELNELTLGPTESLTAYFDRAKTLRDDLTAIGAKPEEEDVVTALLNGLTGEYDMLATIFEAQDVMPTLDEVFGKLHIVENKVKQHSTPSSSKLLYAAEKIKRRPRAGHGPVKGAGAGKTSGAGKSIAAASGAGYNDVECFYCGKRGHIKSECRKRIRDEESKDKTVALTTISTSASSTDWILDSGATSHITSQRGFLVNAQELQPTHPVGLGDGRIVYATAMGDVLLRQSNGGTVTLMGVLYVPDLHYNLFSLSTAMDAGAEASFNGETCRVKIDGRAVLTAARCGGLYTLDAAATTGEVALVTVNKAIKDKADLWHRRYGHLSYGALSRLQRDHMVEGLDVSAQEFKDAASNTCEPCIMGKQHRKPFPTSTSATQKRLELVHMDVCGPMEVPSLAGHRYFATHLDDNSGHSIVIPLKTKAEVADAAIEVLEEWRAQTGEVVRRVRTDNGGEYVNKKLQGYFKKHGIIHETTAPYTPEQNGKAERLNRTLVESARAMLHDAQLSKRFWAEAIVMANYLRVRSPTATGTTTPFEAFVGDKPDISDLRVFGSIAYVHTPKEKRRKLDNKAIKGTFLGYAPHTKAYRVLVNGKVVVSRDVVFNEQDTLAPTAAQAEELKELDKPRPVDPSTASGVPTTTQPTGDQASVGAAQPSTAVRAFSEELQDDEDGDSELDALQGAGDIGAGATSNTGNRTSGRVRREPDRLAFITNGDFNDDPRDEREALARPDSDLWRQAMDEEYASLLKNQTWELAELPPGKEPVDCKWVLKIKRDSQGMIERYKARLVAKGYSQQAGVDFNEVYAPVSKYATLRAFLAKVSAEDLELQHWDIKTAFLNGRLEEEIYMRQPPLYHSGGPRIVCRLLRSLYGLRQAPRAWHTRLKEILTNLEFAASNADASLYILKTSSGNIYLLIYVDDLLCAGNNLPDIERVFTLISSVLDARNVGSGSYFLHMAISRNRPARTLFLSQERYTLEIIAKFNMDTAHPRAIPLSVSSKLTRYGDEQCDKAWYGALIGSLLYLAVCTRPDIAHAVGVLARYMSAPLKEHWEAGKGVLRYLRGTANYGLKFSKASTLRGYCDADYAGDIDTRRSTAGFIFILNDGAIAWGSKLQPTVAASTTEAEYMAAGVAVKEGLWIRKLLADLDIGMPGEPINIYCDNQGAIKLLKHPIASMRSKHIDVIHHFARERVSRREVKFLECSTADNAADCLTKALAQEKLQKSRLAMGVISG